MSGAGTLVGRIRLGKAPSSCCAGIQVDSVVFSTWYGGGDATWSPPEETFTLFKNMRLFRADAPIAEKASGVEAESVAAAQQGAVTLPLQDIEPQY